MAKLPRLPMTRYRVVPQKDGSYGVEITRPGEEPVIMNRFWTEAEADAWITTEQIRTAEHKGPKGPPDDSGGNRPGHRPPKPNQNN